MRLCSIADCEAKHHAKGFCVKHYKLNRHLQELVIELREIYPFRPWRYSRNRGGRSFPLHAQSRVWVKGNREPMLTAACNRSRLLTNREVALDPKTGQAPRLCSKCLDLMRRSGLTTDAQPA